MSIPERPAFGTAPVRCGKTKWSWRGFETEMQQVEKRQSGGVRWTVHVCPTCGNDDYMFITPNEVKAWDRKKSKEASNAG